MKRLLFCLLLGITVLRTSAPGRERVRALLDTDAFNEIDDQFFVAYAVSQKDFEIAGISAAQYRWEQGSVDESYYEIRRVLDLMGLTKPPWPVVRGSDAPMRDDRTPIDSPAVGLMYRAAMKADSRPLYILAVGALTNVASAIVLHPEIKPRIRVVWLGGFPPDGSMTEFNCQNDRAAVKAVFESGVDLTVVPTETSARFLTLPYAEAEQRLSHTNALGAALLALLRDYGDRNKIIWDISTAAYLRQVASGMPLFEVTREPAAHVDLAAAKYVRRAGPQSITVCGKPDRQAIFSDLFRILPEPDDSDSPYLLSAIAYGTNPKPMLFFSKPLDPLSAANASCYSGPGDGAPRSARLAGPRTVELDFAGAVTGDIRVTCVKDRAGNPMLSTRDRVPIHVEGNGTRGLMLSAYRVPRNLDTIPAPEGHPIYQGIIPTLDWPSPMLPPQASPSGNAVLLVAEGYVYLPLDHRYEFYLHAFDMARVYLDGKLLLDQGDPRDRSARRTTFRKAGVYPIRIEQYVTGRRFGLTLQWNLPFHDQSLIPDQALSHRASKTEIGQ